MKMVMFHGYVSLPVGNGDFMVIFWYINHWLQDLGGFNHSIHRKTIGKWGGDGDFMGFTWFLSMNLIATSPAEVGFTPQGHQFRDEPDLFQRHK